MKKLTSLILTLALAAFLLTSTAFAMEGTPAGSCPTGFAVHDFMHHADGEHMHRHIGLHEDLNGDGFICVKELSSGFHVHVDNYLP